MRKLLYFIYAGKRKLIYYKLRLSIEIKNFKSVVFFTFIKVPLKFHLTWTSSFRIVTDVNIYEY